MPVPHTPTRAPRAAKPIDADSVQQSLDERMRKVKRAASGSDSADCAICGRTMDAVSTFLLKGTEDSAKRAHEKLSECERRCGIH